MVLVGVFQQFFGIFDHLPQVAQQALLSGAEWLLTVHDIPL
jgi:hypothetical protein